MSPKPRKLQRVSKACDFCHRRSIKCSKSNDALGRCQNCVDFDVSCTFDRPAKRRGVKAGTKGVKSITDSPTAQTPIEKGPDSSASRSSMHPESASRSFLPGDPWICLNQGSSTAEAYDGDGALCNSWKAFAIASNQQIRNLVQVYFEIVYPIFPLFHKPSFIERVKNGEHLHDRGLFASTMAVCSLVSGRARDGALYTNRWRREELLEPPSEAFYAAARDSLPRDLAAAKGMNYMRACAILAIASIQNGQIKNMQKFFGMYHTLTTMEGFHDEKLWPKDLSAIEVEERRRLFWSLYTFDIYTSIVWGGMIRYREAHSLVRYPTEVDDQYITLQGYTMQPLSPGASTLNQSPASIVSSHSLCWMQGWNFTTDLYRILEYVVDGTRRKSSAANGTQEVWSLFSPASMSEPAVMERVLSMYSALPSHFREAPPTTGDMGKDLYGFQSANIQATLQLLRMVLLSAEETGFERKCDVAGELLRVFSKVPVEYLKAISSPLLHHLGGIGYILGSVMEGSLSDSSYLRVRTLLLEMADLLHRLESGLHRAAGASERLRSQVERIDGYMRTSRLLNVTTVPPPPNGNAMQMDVKPEYIYPPPTYTHSTPTQSVGATVGINDQMMQFQLPPELLSDWPWPLDNSQSEGFLPLAFE